MLFFQEGLSMPIEFRCRQCGKLLRTGDETAGRQAQCPACSALTTIPGSARPETAGPDSSQAVPLSPLGEEIPFSPDRAAGNPFAGGPNAPDATGPGATASHPSYPSTANYAPAVTAAERVQGPATALIVTAILGLTLNVLNILINMIPMGFDFGMAVMKPFGHPPLVNHVANLFFAGLGLMLGLFVLMGAIQMRNLQNYGFALVAAIIAIIPCTSPCCLLGLPFGIWALVVLADPSLRTAFRS
jgi:phage FluMu protein Com